MVSDYNSLKTDYLQQAAESQVAVLSQQCFVQSAHFVESQQHSVAVSSQQASAFFELLHEHATAAAIAATIAIAINTFFMITNNLIGLIQYTFLKTQKYNFPPCFAKKSSVQLKDLHV